MTGYEYIKNMTDMELSKNFRISHKEAVAARNSTLEEMIKNPDICKECLGIPGECRERITNCNKCRAEFLKGEQNDRL